MANDTRLARETVKRRTRDRHAEVRRRPAGLHEQVALTRNRDQHDPAGDTVSEHAAHLFQVITVKENGSELPWYPVDGSIMTSFPDTWALDEHFICLPLNHLDRPFRRVRLGGITCDRDDVYPPLGSTIPLFLPDVDATDLRETTLYLGFFSVGAYQEMLGGVRGSKHCVLPEATEILIDDDGEGGFRCDILPGHTTEDVPHNLGYGRTARLGAARTAAPVPSVQHHMPPEEIRA